MKNKYKHQSQGTSRYLSAIYGSLTFSTTRFPSSYESFFKYPTTTMLGKFGEDRLISGTKYNNMKAQKQMFFKLQEFWDLYCSTRPLGMNRQTGYTDGAHTVLLTQIRPQRVWVSGKAGLPLLTQNCLQRSHHPFLLHQQAGQGAMWVSPSEAGQLCWHIYLIHSRYF